MISVKYSRFLPFERYTVKTGLSEEEIIERLKIITRTTETIQFSARKAVILRSNYDYNGEISGRNFEIRRNISYRNSFLPIIKGKIAATSGKTEILISMDISLPVKVFLIIILSIYGIVSLTLISFSIFLPVILAPAVFLLTLLGFKLEARKSKKDLNIIFNAETE